MRVKKIDTCRNYYILYWGDDCEDLESCLNCGTSRYKMNKDYQEEEDPKEDQREFKNH
jgi:Zn ribbon nucleic-acid-binding protein